MPSVRAAILITLSVCACVASAWASPPTYSDLAYSSNWRQRLDLYLPAGGGPSPVVVYIHGGGWLAGDKSHAERYADDLNARGFALAAVNYRYSYQASFPAQLHDCKGAIRWLRANAGAYGLDATRFAAFGESAGGHLASLVATTSGDAALEGSVGGHMGESSQVQAVVDGYGPADLVSLAEFSGQRGSEITALIGHDIYDIIDHWNSPAYADLVALVNAANPVLHADAGDPPMHIVHGLDDEIVPSSQSESLADAMNAAGVVVTLRLLTGVEHDLPDSTLPEIYEFLESQLLGASPERITIPGQQSGEGFGHSMAVIGDVDGDDVDDLVIGSPFNDDKGADAGRVSVHSGATGQVLRVIRGQASGDRFGFSVVSCGDVNGDGRGDFVVGASMSDARGNDSGRVDVFLGGTWKRWRAFEGEKSGDQFGFSVAAVDVDGDGVREVVVGAPFADGPASNCGAAIVHSMTASAPIRRMRGRGTNDQFGKAVASAGDFNGDGRADIVIGAPLADDGGVDSGSISVVGITGGKWTTHLRKHGSAGAKFGSAVAGLGDANGDGRSDVIVGAPTARNFKNRTTGMAYVFSKSQAEAIVTIAPSDEQAGQQFGAAVAAAGDVDGDGRADALVAAPRHSTGDNQDGRVSVFDADGINLGGFDGESANAAMGTSIVGRNDLNGDGVLEVLAGAPGSMTGGIPRGMVYILPSQGAP